MASTSVPVITLPQPALMRQWMAQYHVPAAGIGLVTGGRVVFKVYGELSKGIPAPPNTVWGSKALVDAISILKKIENREMGILPPVDLFTELNMPDTTFGVPIKVLNRMARPHNKRDGIYVFKPYDTDNHLFTTIADLCKLLIHLNQQAGTIGLSGMVTETDEEYGWRQLYSSSGNHQGIVHCAVGNGASNALLLLPLNKQAIVILTNSDNGKMLEQHILKEYRVDIACGV